MSYPTTRHADPAPARQPRWGLRGAELAALLVVGIGAGPAAARSADRGVMTTAAPGVRPPRPAAARSSITAWTI